MDSLFPSVFSKQNASDNPLSSLALSPTPSNFDNDVRQLISNHINTKNYATALLLCVSVADNNDNLVAASLIYSVIDKAAKYNEVLLNELHSICEAAQPTSIASRYALGVIYSIGYEKEAKEEQDKLAVAYFTQAANSGYAPAQSELGCMYGKGRGVPEDDVEAVRLFQLAANQRYAPAQYNLGRLYSSGRGVPKDDVEAARWFQLAADQGYAPAQSNLGVMYSYGRGVPRDGIEAVRLFKLAADDGYAKAQYNLGFSYQRGNGVPKSDVNAVHFYQLAADQGYAAAQNSLGVMHAKGRGVLKNNVEAVHWYQLAADQGYAAAQNNLGKMYSNGYGVPKSSKSAANFYQKAVNQGNVKAHYHLGWLYLHGYGVQEDYTKAAWHYQQAADRGHIQAQHNLGMLYDQGRGKVSPETEDVYCNAIRELGVPENVYLFHLGMRYLNGIGVDRQSYSQARKNLEKAESLGHPSAAFYLGESYRKPGYFSKRRNSTEAKKWYIKAAQSGDKQVEANAALKKYYTETKTIHIEPLFTKNKPTEDIDIHGEL